MNRNLWLAVLASAMLAGAVPARAETAPAAGDPGMEAAMKAAMERNTPGEAHQVFAPLAGRWTYTGQMWMTPGAPASPMNGSSVNTLKHGGRFLEQQITGQMPDMPPFEGTALLGYDNIRKEYQSVWHDNMATGMMSSTGSYDPASKTITFKGDYSCAMTGEAHKPMRDTWKFVDADHTVYESFSNGPDGKEFKMMEITYTRAQ